MSILINLVKDSIEKAKKHQSKIEIGSDLETFIGMTSPKIKHFMNNLCSHDDVRYLEIGLGTGSVHYAALFNNEHTKAYGCDLWTKKKVGEDGRESFHKNYKKFIGKLRTKIFDGSCWEIPEGFLEDKINVYFFDGPHEIIDHQKAIVDFWTYLDDEFILLIDDWNDHRVKIGTNNALDLIKPNILFEKTLPAVIGDTPPHWGDMNRWWNGWKIFVIRK